MSRPRGARIAAAVVLAISSIDIVASSVAGASVGPARGTCTGAESALRSAAEALVAGRWDEAERLLLPLAASHAECAQVALGLARSRDGRGDTAEAERLFERATALDPGDAPAHAFFAAHWLSRGQAARADYLSARALALDPDCPEALVAQGRVLLARGRVPQGVQALEKAVRLAPQSAEAHYQLGVVFFRRQLQPDAVRELQAAVARRPADARAYDYLALAFEALGQPEQAEAAYRSALGAKDGAFADAYVDLNYGRFLLKQGRLEESRAHLDRAVELHPASRAARYQRGRLHLALGAYAAAREDAERALVLRNEDASVLDLQVYYLLATIYRRLGEAELARKYAELARTTAIPGQD